MPGRPPSLPDTSSEKFSPSFSMHASVIPSKPIVDEVLTMGDVFDECIETQPVAPAKPSIKVSNLSDRCYVLPNYSIFVEKLLPETHLILDSNQVYPVDYFVALHEAVTAPGVHFRAGTPNYLGARIPLSHTSLNIKNWHELLMDYPHREIVQFLEFGFPLGLQQEPVLESSLKNHSSSYQYYDFVDDFFRVGLEQREIAGPCRVPPFPCVHVSPLMTAPKKPGSRRAVFDATFGTYSLNNNTPKDIFMDEKCHYDFPTVDEFKDIVVKEGRGSFMWKRDLSRFYLQIPLDPVEYPKVCCIWRGNLYFFVALMFGLTHSGLQGQKVSSAVKWVHRNMGLEIGNGIMFNSLNYSDDIGGCEASEDRANLSFESLGNLFETLGLREAISKACSPSTRMSYLGVEFDSLSMTMSVPPDKIQELRNDLSIWLKKSKASKKALQSILGKLFWVSRCVRFSRGFMGRLLCHLRAIHHYPDHKNLPIPDDCREDLSWWSRYLRHFNGVELMYPEMVHDMQLDELIQLGATVVCGDAQPLGGGAYFNDEYWSSPFPPWLADPEIPIHVKEFWVVIASAALWGDQWHGKTVYIFCDNSAVVNVLDGGKPRDVALQALLREFLYIVCTRRFTPIIRHIGTERNFVADFLSRNHGGYQLGSFIEKLSLNLKHRRTIPDAFFKLNAVW